MANKRKKAKKAKLKKNKDRLGGESFDGGRQEITQEESDGASVCLHTIIFTLESNPSHAQFMINLD